MQDRCYQCGIKLDWTVDDCQFLWVKTDKAQFKVMTFCNQCANARSETS